MDYSNTGSIEAFASDPSHTPGDTRKAAHDAPRSLGTTKTPTRTHREKDDTYWGVVLRLNDSWRVVVCSDGRQWILQHRKSENAWRGRKYFSRAEYVPATVKELVGEKACALAIDWVRSLSQPI
jgi:hypothetical protein